MDIDIAESVRSLTLTLCQNVMQHIEKGPMRYKLYYLPMVRGLEGTVVDICLQFPFKHNRIVVNLEVNFRQIK